jgi:hypothetical protein
MAVQVPIEVTVSEPEPGLWCGTCLLPSVTAVILTTTIGSATPALRVLKMCDGCERITAEDF